LGAGNRFFFEILCLLLRMVLEYTRNLIHLSGRGGETNHILFGGKRHLGVKIARWESELSIYSHTVRAIFMPREMSTDYFLFFFRFQPKI